MQRHLNRNFIYLMSVWTLIIFCLAYYDTATRKLKDEQALIAQAQTFSKFIDIAGMWNNSHNGVYVPITEKTPPNPYLVVQDRDISGPGGKKLTLQNPSYMIRQFSDLSSQLNGVVFHHSSLTPVNPVNSSYKWEEELFNELKFMDTESYNWPKEKSDNGKTYFRYMKSMWTKDSCLKCHFEQGFKVGDLRGGLSISIPTDNILDLQWDNIVHHWIVLFIIWALGFFVSFISHVQLLKTAKEKKKLTTKLKNSLDEIKTLRGLLPICANCKQIRDEKGVWNKIEEYFSEHLDAKFTHSYCPNCIRELYPDVADEVLAELNDKKS